MKDIPNEQKLSWKLRFWTAREFKNKIKIETLRSLPISVEYY